MPVRVKNLTVRFDDFSAIDRVSHSFEPGTATSIMGVNGSGKTTMLQSIAGLVPPTSGLIDGVPERIAYVSQHLPSSWMPLTSKEVLAMGRYRERGLVRWFRATDRQAMYQAGERLNVNYLSNRSFGELSGGQRQRVRIAQALASEPELLLLDEPITGLDIPSQERILDVIQDYSHQGAVVIFTTHHLAEARHSDSVLLLDNQLIAAGTPEDVLTAEQIRRAFGARLLGAHGDASALGT